MLLDINRDLLMEVMRIQALQSEIKKEAEAESNADTKFSERRAQSSKDYGECVHVAFLSQSQVHRDGGTAH